MNVSELFFMILLIMPGILLMLVNEKELYRHILQDEEPPSLLLRLVNHVILSVPFVLLGLFSYERAGFDHALSLARIDLLSLLIGLACALINVFIYYFYFKKRVTKAAFVEGERNRQTVWIWTRCLYGGVVEEAIFRFGLMSFFVWIDNFLFPALLSIWIANLLASLLFALAHLPGIYQMKNPVTKIILYYSFSMNLFVGLVCGWLYWQYGLAAAVLCHMLFHIVWYFFEKTVFKTPAEQVS